MRKAHLVKDPVNWENKMIKLSDIYMYVIKSIRLISQSNVSLKIVLVLIKFHNSIKWMRNKGHRRADSNKKFLGCKYWFWLFVSHVAEG